LSIQEITQVANKFGLKLGNLDDLDEKMLKELHRAITEYSKNRHNIHTIDYLW